MSRKPLFSLVQVRKRYGLVIALSLENLVLNHNEMVLITGENGAGKSTLLRVLGGITRISEGKVNRSTELMTKRIAFVPQHGGLYPHLSLADNMIIWSRLYDLSKPVPGTGELLKQMGLANSLDRKVIDLSGGQQKLATLASALAVAPDVLLLDEPLSGLDEIKSDVVLATIAETAKNRLLTVITAHPKLKLPFGFRRIELIRRGPY